jgi:hypothetical protein
VSGYDGSFLGLGGFIEACKPGEIVKGKPVLAIEVIDHLGRYHFMIFLKTGYLIIFNQGRYTELFTGSVFKPTPQLIQRIYNSLA